MNKLFLITIISPICLLGCNKEKLSQPGNVSLTPAAAEVAKVEVSPVAQPAVLEDKDGKTVITLEDGQEILLNVPSEVIDESIAKESELHLSAADLNQEFALDGKVVANITLSDPILEVEPCVDVGLQRTKVSQIQKMEKKYLLALVDERNQSLLGLFESKLATSEQKILVSESQCVPAIEVPDHDPSGDEEAPIVSDPKQEPENGRDQPGRDLPGREAPGRNAPGRDLPGRNLPGRSLVGR